MIRDAGLFPSNPGMRNVEERPFMAAQESIFFDGL